MDARPVRPRGGENAAPSLHQRHKSTGNLLSQPSAAPPGGIRGPAKRAAFGDLTNTNKYTVGGREGPKVHKVQSALHLDKSAISSAASKEDVLASKDAPGRAVQKLQPLPERNPRQDIRAVETYIERFQNLSTTSREPAAVATGRVAALPFLEECGEPNPTGLPPKQPRHHQSQPQLKKTQPTLRKTQSRQLERLGDSDEAFEASSEGSDTSGVCEGSDVSGAPAESVASSQDAPMLGPGDGLVSLAHAYAIGLIDPPATEAADLHASEDVATDAIAQGQRLEPPSDTPRLPEISEASGSIHDGLTARLSESDEHWYDEDEYCDDDDQGYTTGHSFRSRDMTGGVTTLLQPKVTSRVHQELEEAKAEVIATRSPSDIEDEAWDVSMVAEYGDEIFDYLREMEVKMLPNPHYMDIQTEIQWSMRAVLMEWLVQVHGRFHLLPETLFLTVNYVDRFLSSKVVSIGKLQLVGATAILVASKYEEINCPSLQEIIYMVDGGYSEDEVLKAERFMLSMLGFELGWPGPMSFLRRVSKADDYDYDTRTLAKYFLELTIMDERFVASTPSFLAAGAHCLSRLILNKGHWTKHHVHYSGYTWSQLRPLVTMMLECCEDPDNHHRAIFDKYSKERFKEASLMVQSVLDSGFTIAHDTGPAPARAMRSAHLQTDDHLVYQNLNMPAMMGMI